MKTISLGFSPCPNDCFIFDALVHHKIDTEDLDFAVVMEDVEALNQKAFKSELDVTKLSYHALGYVTNKYALLYAGSALGNNCGPLLISKRDVSIEEIKNGNLSIAIPGKYTTANFLFSLAFPNTKNKNIMLFSEIEQAVIDEKVDAGVIIHENRFTYQLKGLKKIIDLGEYWEQSMQAPIPLGGIVVNRNLSKEIQLKINRLIRNSVEFAFANPSSSMQYVKQHAQEMDEAVMKQHIDLYVNKYSIDLGIEGKRAVELMLAKASEIGLIPEVYKEIFV